ncbi:MAG: glycosyltransferase family 87 protein [Chloroflexota bacterium]
MTSAPGMPIPATDASPAVPRVPGPSMPRGWRSAWTPARARLWLVAAAVAAWLPLLGVPLRGWLDFSAFYSAGQLAFTPDVTGLAPITAYQAAHGLPITPFVYPAGMALPYALLATLPYGVAAALHAAIMAALLVAAAVLWADIVALPRRWAVLAALAWAPAAAGVASGQNTSVALILVVLATGALVRRREALGGVLAGVLAYKPQLVAPLAGLLLIRGRWRALGAAVAVLGVHWALGVVATGGRLDWPRDWLATVNAYQAADLAANGWQAISLPGLAARAGSALGLPWLVWAGYAAAGVIIVACIPALRRFDWPAAVALAMALGLLISPHAWVYDATLLLPALGVLAVRASSRGWPWRDRWWLAAAFGVALAWPIGGVVGVTAMPLVVLAMPLALLERGPFQPRPGEWSPAQAPAAAPASAGVAPIAETVAR